MSTFGGDVGSIGGDSATGFGGGVMGGTSGDSFVTSPSPPARDNRYTNDMYNSQPFASQASGSITQYASLQQPPQQQFMGTQNPQAQISGQFQTQQLQQHPTGLPMIQSQQYPHSMPPQPSQPQIQPQYAQAQYSVATALPSSAASGGSYASRSAAAFAASAASAASSVQHYQTQQQSLVAPPNAMRPTAGGSYNVPIHGHAQQPQQSQVTQQGPTPPQQAVSTPSKSLKHPEDPIVVAHQNRILTDCTRRVQEHAYYMKQAMDKDELPTILDRAAQMVGELGDGMSSQLTPKNYYELHMRALDDLPNLEEYFVSLSATDERHTMQQLYSDVQFSPKVLPRLYLQICAGSALIRSTEQPSKWVLNDLIECVKCVQNPVRGLFLRHYLLQVTRDKLPDGADVQDGYEFVLANFIEMNKLWVRLQHLPGENKSKEQRKRRERERNELRILVGTNLVRLSQLEGVTSKIYGEIILPKILEQVTACGDPLAQAYLIDCVIQVFPDENHLETLPILLAVCPKLRDKVNIRTILQSLMERLNNYYADEELLDEEDKNQVKKSLAKDSFPMFEKCVHDVYNARGPKLSAKEVIRLQTALLNYSLKCYPGDMMQVNRCLGVCVEFIRQARNGGTFSPSGTATQSESQLEEAAVVDLEKMLSVPLETFALKILTLDNFSTLLQFLPRKNCRDVGVSLLRAIDSSGTAPCSVAEIEQLFTIVSPVLRNDMFPTKQMAENALGVAGSNGVNEVTEENGLLAKLIHLLDNDDTDLTFELLSVAKKHLSAVENSRICQVLSPIVFSGLRLASRVNRLEYKTSGEKADVHDEPESEAQEAQSESETKAPDPSEETSRGASISQKLQGSVSNENVEAREAKEEAAADQKGQPEPKGDNGDDNRLGGPEGMVTVECEAAKQVREEIPRKFSCRDIFVFLQVVVAQISKGSPELALRLYLEICLAAGGMAKGENMDKSADTFKKIALELISQAFLLYEEEMSTSRDQLRGLLTLTATVQSCDFVRGDEYETLVTKVAHYSARLSRKQDQCKMVALCSSLFFPTGNKAFQRPQRSLECLQRCLKIADSVTSLSPENVYLFVDLLDQYVAFFELGNPVITDTYISGLVALVREHFENMGGLQGEAAIGVADAKGHFNEIVQYIRRKKKEELSAGRFGPILLDS